MTSHKDTKSRRNKPRVVQLAWHSVSETLPDADITVLCGFADGEICTGYLDEVWRSTEALRFVEEPTFWAHLPELPTRNLDDVQIGRGS
jgi:hypothetical protein